MRQNKGAKPKEMHPKRHGGSKSQVPGATGETAVEFRGTYVHTAQHEGVTRPSKGNAGSHDHKIREHADHND